MASLDILAERILAFSDQCIAEQPIVDFRGSHFRNTASERPRPGTESEQDIRQVVADHHSWVQQQLHTLLIGNESNMPFAYANMLLLYLDGGLAGAKMSKGLNPLQMTRDLARDLVT